MTETINPDKKKHYSDGYFSNKLIDVKNEIERNDNINKCSPENFIYNLIPEQDDEANKFLSNIDQIKKIEFILDNGAHQPLTEIFDIIKIIGRGSFGVVVEVFHKKYHKRSACKIIERNKIEDEEIDFAMKMNHPNLIRQYDYFSNDKYYFLCLDLMEGGSLKNLIVSRYNSDTFFKESEVATIMRGIINGLDFMHNLKIVHRDIKPENIMFQYKDNLESVKIGDFGLSKKIEGRSAAYGGTLVYMAPEQIFGMRYSSNIDMWACGFMLCIMCSGGTHPIITDKNMLYQETYVEGMRRVKERGWIVPQDFPELAWNLFTKLCRYDTSFRYESYFALVHPWITRTLCFIPETIKEKSEKNKKTQEFREVYDINIDVIYLYIFE
jgi:serine/threonine protein kinase